MGAIEYMTGVMLIAAVVFTPYALLTSDDLGSLHGTDWLWILFIVLVPGAGGHVVMGWAHKYVDVSVSSLMTLGVPVVSAIAAWWWLDEGMSAGQLVGGAIVLGALAAIVRPPPRTRTGGGRARADLRGCRRFATPAPATPARKCGESCNDCPASTPASCTSRRRRPTCTSPGSWCSTRRPRRVEWTLRRGARHDGGAAASRSAVPPSSRRSALRAPSSGVDRRPRLRSRLPPASHRGAAAGSFEAARRARGGDRRSAARSPEAAVGGLDHRGSRTWVHRGAHEDSPRRHRRSVGQRDDARDARHRAGGPSRRARPVEARPRAERLRARRLRDVVVGPSTGRSSSRRSGAAPRSRST